MSKRCNVLVLLLLAAVAAVSSSSETTTNAAPPAESTVSGSFVSIGSNQKTAPNGTNQTVAVARNVASGGGKVLNAPPVITSLKSIQTGSGGSGAPAGSFVSSTTMIMIVSFLAGGALVAIIVGTSVFMMKRRFSVWRLNNSKMDLNCGAGSSAASSAGGESSEDKTSSLATSPGGGAATEATAVAGAEMPAKDADVPIVVEIADETKPAPLEQCEKTETAAGKEETPTACVEPPPSAAKPELHSHSSLIVNVLNELSESVAQKVDETPQPTTQPPNNE